MTDINHGLAHLVSRAGSAAGIVPACCAKIKTLLDGVEYYVPANRVEDIKPLEIPPFPIHVDSAYSEIGIKNASGLMEVAGVKKHSKLTILGTGCTVELVAPPKWWSKRDSGGI